MQRRTVLRSAVKLAYATPLIAASATLSQQGASASPLCNPVDCPAPCFACATDGRQSCLPQWDISAGPCPFV